MIAVDTVAERLDAVRHRITAAGGQDVTVVAVTKGFGADAIAAAMRVGLADIGENYAQELLPKLAGLAALGGAAGSGGERPRVHFIGRLQSNKVKNLASVVDVWQTVDRRSLGTMIAKHQPGARVLVQVNISGEPHKGGCPPSDAPALVGELRGLGLIVEGLMGVGPLGAPEHARPGFRLLRHLTDDLGLATCSMGMTDDLDVAVEEGSTMVRVGSALFGMRPVSSARAH